MFKIWRIVVVILLLGTLLNVGVTVAQEHELIWDSSVTKSPNLFVGANRQSKNATELAGMSVSPDRDSPWQNIWPEGVPREAYLLLDHHDSSAHSCPPGTCEYVKGRVLIKFVSEIKLRRPDSKAEWTEEAGLNRALAVQGVERLEQLFPQASSSPGPNASPLSLDNKSGSKRALADWYVATLADEEADVRAVVQALSQAPDVEYVEPDYVARRAGAPNDPRYAEQWGLEKVQIEAAWDLTAGDPAIVIALADSGIDLDHPDLVPNLWTNPGEIAGNGLDDDNNGYVDDVRGWNFVAGTNDLWDDNGHGSLVAGIAAARSGNGIGIAGVCGECRIMPVKVMQPSGAANYSDIAAGIVYATDKGSRVINLSLGGYADSVAVADAVAYATAQNVVLVGGVGNDNTSMPFYPAAYDDVIAVAGTTISDTRTVFTNYGTWVDVSAPGEDILTTALGSDYITTSGTSMAAPFAAGLAGLLLSLHPDWTPALVRSQLMHTADPIDDLNPGYEGKLGGGRINAASAVLPPESILSYAGYSVDGTPNGRPDFGADATLTVAVHSDWADVADVTASLATTDPYVTIDSGTAIYGDLLSGQTVANSDPFSIAIGAGAGYNHIIHFTLSLSGNGGNYTRILAFIIATRSDVELVGNRIKEDKTWTSDKTYLLESDVSVLPGVTLTIEPGTVVSFNGDYLLEVGGTLVADGTSDQPIIFQANTYVHWNRIYFHDLATDAVTDASGAYQSGCILRHVLVHSATSGIVSDSATPYLAHLTVDGGGINCGVGSTPFWLLDSTVTGDVYVSGTGYVWRSSILNGNLSLGDASEVLTSTVVGHISAGANSIVSSNEVELGGISMGDGSLIQSNSIQDAPGVGIQTNGSVTISGNRVIGSDGAGVVVSNGLVQGNLIANCAGDGLHVGAATVISNTFTGIEGRTLYTSAGIPLKIEGNNFEFNHGPYDIYNGNPSGQAVVAKGNWWGTSDVDIEDRIYDYQDDWSLGEVSYTPVLNAPCSSAPAYVRSVALTPASPVGIQTATFDVEFSRDMDPSLHPQMRFFTTVRGRWTTYTTENSGLPSYMYDIAIAPNGEVWLGHGGAVTRFDGTNWTVYDPENSPFPDVNCRDVAFDKDGTKWFATSFGFDRAGLIRFDDINWTLYNRANSDIASTFSTAIAMESDGTIWLATEGAGVERFDRSNWTVYNSSNSGLPGDRVWDVAIDHDGAKWFGTDAGVARFDGWTWTVYDTSNSGLPYPWVGSIVFDQDGSKWFGCASDGSLGCAADGSGGAVVKFDGTTWTVYDRTNSPVDSACKIAIESDGTKWFLSWYQAIRFDGVTWTVYDELDSPVGSMLQDIVLDDSGSKWFAGNSLVVLHDGPDYFIERDPRWLDSTHYRATYDFSALIPRDTYSLTVSSAVGTDGIEIAPYSGSTFTVDYAGYIADTTPPNPPSVTASGDGTTTSICASWSVTDPESPITLYRYAIGTAPGGTNVVNWTNISAAEVERGGLNLLQGETYYVSVKARNEGGIWSEPGVSNGVVAGVVANTSVPLHPGWNLISVPMSPDSTTITDVLSNIEGKYDLVYAYDASDASDPWKKYNTAAPSFLNDLTEIDEIMGLWIRATEGVILTVSGSAPSSTDIPLYTGWNLVGHPSQTTHTITEALASIDGKYDLVYAYDASDATDPWKKYNTAAPYFLNDLTEMGPGWGYWIRVTQDCTWSVP